MEAMTTRLVRASYWVWRLPSLIQREYNSIFLVFLSGLGLNKLVPLQNHGIYFSFCRLFVFFAIEMFRSVPVFSERADDNHTLDKIHRWRSAS